MNEKKKENLKGMRNAVSESFVSRNNFFKLPAPGQTETGKPLQLPMIF